MLNNHIGLVATALDNTKRILQRGVLDTAELYIQATHFKYKNTSKIITFKEIHGSINV